MAANLQALITRHCDTFRSNVASIRSLLPALRDNRPNRAQAAATAADLAHQLAGAGGSIGFRPVSVAAKALEDAIKPLLAVAPDTTRYAVLAERFAALETIVEGLTPEQSTLYNVDLSQLSHRAAWPAEHG